jgi:hypothetical protein
MTDVKPEIGGIAPLFIVKNVPVALAFYSSGVLWKIQTDVITTSASRRPK